MVKKSKNAEIEKVRRELLEIEGVNAAVIADTDGDIIGSGPPTFARAVARLIAMAEGATADFGDQAPEEIIMSSKTERIIVMQAGTETLLAVKAEPEANQNLISLEMLRAAGKIEELMKQRRR